MPFQCEECRKMFKSSYLLNRHKSNKRNCTGSNIIKTSYECEKCGYTTYYKSHYDKHTSRKTMCNIKNDVNEMNELKAIVTDLKNTIKSHKETIKSERKTINYNFIVNNFSNALNIEDCLNKDMITNEIIQKCENLKLKDGGTYIVDVLCDINPTIRPIHCTDSNRHKFIIRTEDTWKLDGGGDIIKSHIKPVVAGVYNNIYGEKLKTEQTREDRLIVLDNLKDLMSANIDKQCNNIIHNCAEKFAVKKIDDNTLTDNILNIVDE